MGNDGGHISLNSIEHFGKNSIMILIDSSGSNANNTIAQLKWNVVSADLPEDWLAN